MAEKPWITVNPSGSRRVIVTKQLPGEHWLRILERADCRIEICPDAAILTTEEIVGAIGTRCQAAIGQLTETWGERLFSQLKAAGGLVYSNYAVGFNNVDLAAATRHGIPVGNTPGVLTATTAEMAVALTFAAARRLGEAERYLRRGQFRGWLPTLFVGELLTRKTVGIIGAGRIGAAYARMMVEGQRMNLIYHDLYRNQSLEADLDAFNAFLSARGEEPVTYRKASSLEELVSEADCISLHTVLDETTHHLIDAKRLALMKKNAILINTSRGPVIDEAALVEHARTHPDFRAGLEVVENEPTLTEGLTALENVVLVPHIASATQWTRSGMASLAAGNVAAILQGYPVWNRPHILDFLSPNPPLAAPSIVNAKELGMPLRS